LSFRDCTARKSCAKFSAGIAHQEETGQEACPTRGTMPEILLAEDNPADVYLIREALHEHGVDCALRVAADGKDVMTLLSGEGAPPDLMILDLNLPRHDGIEILQRVRATDGMAHIPVVVLTSSDSPRDRQVAIQLGATRYIKKPSSLEQFLELGAVFKELLAAHESRSKESANEA
jgi:chemotaxis family two-component system response regulator Rcp1